VSGWEVVVRNAEKANIIWEAAKALAESEGGPTWRQADGLIQAFGARVMLASAVSDDASPALQAATGDLLDRITGFVQLPTGTQPPRSKKSTKLPCRAS
jgi:hypothetical protein